MNKEFLLTVLIVLAVALSVSTIYASEVNITDSYAGYSDDVYMAVDNSNVDNGSSNDNIIESDISDNLSTNADSNSLLESDNNANVLKSSSENTLSKISTSKTIVSSNLTKYYHGTGSYKATFYDINGNLLKDTDVVLTLNKNTYTRTTNSKGVVTLGIGLKPGTYNITAYNPVTKYRLTNTIKVLSTIKAKTLSKYYKGSEKYTATFRDTKGSFLGNTDVQLTVNGKTYSVKTDSKGVASLGIGLYPGTYQMTAKNPVNNETVTTNIKVLSTINAKDLTKYYKGSEKYTATFRDTNGNLLSNKDVQLTINSKTYTVKTDSNGVGSLAIGLYPGTYKMTAKNPVNGETITTSIKVLSTINVKDFTKYYKGSAKYTATFRDSNGNLLSNKDVQLTINGKTYTVKTDSKGVGSLAIGLYPGTYQMTAKNPISGETVTTNIKVLTTINATDITKVVTDGRLFYATFLNGEGKPLAKQSISFKINGQTYTRTTDANGLASLSLGTLRVGTYSIVSSNVDGLTITNTVKVIASTSSKLVTSTYNFLTTDTKTIKVTLLNGLGYAPSSGRTVTMKVDGKTYTSTTDSNSIAKFTLTSLGEGNYTATYSFAGDSYYSASSATDKIIVIKNKVPTFTVKSDTTFIKGADNKFQVALMLNGEPVAGKTVTFKVNGVSYAKTTNKNGIATLPIGLAVGKYTITYTNKADSEINSIKGSSALTVIEKYPTTLTWKSGATFNAGTNTFNVLLSNSNGAVSGATVKLVANSKTYTAKTASNGYAKFSVSLPNTGKYTVKFSFDGDTLNAASSGSKAITIEAKGIPINSITDAANTVKTYYANHKKLPDSVTIDGTKFTMPEFLYVMSKAILQLGDSDQSDVVYISGVKDAPGPKGDTIKANLYKAEYLEAADYIVSYITSKNTAPNYAPSSLGKISFSTVTEAFSRVVAFYGNNNKQMPNYVSIDAVASSSSSQNKISIADIITGANSVKTYYATNKALPSTVTAGGISFTMHQFAYVMSKAVYQLGNSDKSAIEFITGISAASSPSGDTINANLNKTNYLTVANNVANYIYSNKQAPNYASSAIGKLSYPIFSDAFARILSYYGTNSQLPSYVTIDSSSSSSVSPGITGEGSGLNEKCTVTNLEPYLVSTKNCPVNDSAIKPLVDSLISGLTTTEQKAIALYNYVRDYISYTFYYDTRYGAVGTLNAKTGNCVDQSHLLIAMFRTAGLPARYVHGSGCTFSSGTYGHVWTQVLIGDNWVVADPTSSRNSFGKIVNWNTNSFTLKGIYSGISF